MQQSANCVRHLREIGLIETYQLAIGQHSDGVFVHLEPSADLFNKLACELRLHAGEISQGKIFVD